MSFKLFFKKAINIYNGKVRCANKQRRLNHVRFAEDTVLITEDPEKS